MQDRGQLLKRRDNAADQVSYGRGAAIAIGVVGCFWALNAGNENPKMAFVRLVLYLSIAVAGFLLRPSRSWAACLLISLLIISLVLSASIGTLLSGIIPRLVAVGVCIKGVIAVFQHERLQRQIAAPEVLDGEKKKEPNQPPEATGSTGSRPAR